MTHVPGNPITGFTLELDGDTEVIERIMRSVNKAISDEIYRAQQEHRERWVGNNPTKLTILEVYGLMPFHGTVHIRTTDQPRDITGTCPHCGRQPGEQHLNSCPFLRL